MNSMAITFSLSQPERKGKSTRRQNHIELRPWLALVGMGGGFLTGLAGLLLTAAAWFVTGASAHQMIARTGTTLLVCMIPLLMLGAACLDSIEGNKPFGELRGQSQVDSHNEEDEL